MNKTNTINKLNFEKLANRIVRDVPINEALKDITPIKRSDEILTGKKQVKSIDLWADSWYYRPNKRQYMLFFIPKITVRISL